MYKCASHTYIGSTTLLFRPLLKRNAQDIRPTKFHHILFFLASSHQAKPGQLSHCLSLSSYCVAFLYFHHTNWLLLCLLLRRPLVISSCCDSWLPHRHSSSFNCAALLPSHCTGWLLHCLMLTSHCTALLLSCCNMWLLCCLSVHRPLVISSCQLVVTLPLVVL